MCATCGSASAWDAKFCQQCGRRLDEHAPSYYGALLPGPVLVLGCVLLAAAALALIAGSVIAALVLLGLAGAVFVFLDEAARRNPDDPVARRVLAFGYRLRGWTTFARTALSAWARALRDVVRLRRESRSLRREREPTLRSLGDAAYRDDEPATNALRERLRQIDDELAKRAAEQARALASARKHVDEEHDAVRPTERLSVDDIASGGKPKK